MMTVSRIARHLMQRYGSAEAYAIARRRVAYHLHVTCNDGWMYIWHRVADHIDRVHTDDAFLCP
jgi:hypothetical protein